MSEGSIAPSSSSGVAPSQLPSAAAMLGTAISSGHAEAGAQVALAPAEPRRVDGEDDRAVAVLGRLLDERRA